MKYIYLLFFLCLCTFEIQAQRTLYRNTGKDSSSTANADSIILSRVTSTKRDTIGYLPNNELFLKRSVNGAVSTLDIGEVKKLPYVSIDQMLTGRVTGVDIRTPSAEPGKRNSVFIRGTSSLLLSNRDIFYAQPAYVVDGVPLIMDHAFAYDKQLILRLL